MDCVESSSFVAYGVLGTLHPDMEKMANPIQWIWITQLISIKLIRCLTIKPVNSVIQRLKNCGARRLPEIKVHHNNS